MDVGNATFEASVGMADEADTYSSGTGLRRMSFVYLCPHLICFWNAIPSIPDATTSIHHLAFNLKKESHEAFDIRKYGDKILDVFEISVAGSKLVTVLSISLVLPIFFVLPRLSYVQVRYFAFAFCVGSVCLSQPCPQIYRCNRGYGWRRECDEYQ